MNMPLNSVGGALQVLDFVMNAMPSKGGGGGPAMGGPGGGTMMQQGQPKKPLPVVGGVGKSLDKGLNRGINRGINMGINRSLGRGMRAIHF
jgi:hypothetical protein